jgi:hypothetical protein
MSEPFVNGPFPMRWEFDTLLNDLTAAAFEVPTNGVAYAEARADVLRAYDAALARIAELESPAYRACIAREFMDAVDAEWLSDGTGSMDEIRDAILARWEAAAKEGE